MVRDGVLIFGRNGEDSNRGKETGKIRWQAEIGRTMQSSEMHKKEEEEAKRELHSQEM